MTNDEFLMTNQMRNPNIEGSGSHDLDWPASESESSTDPVTFTAVVFLLAAVALFACWLPAHCASKVDPMAALAMNKMNIEHPTSNIERAAEM